MSALAYDNGFRCVDMCRLTVQNANEFLASNGSNILGKGRFGGKLAFQKFSPLVRDPLEQYLAHREKLMRGVPALPNLLVMEGRDGIRPCKEKDVESSFHRVSKISGIKANPHDGRRTFGHQLHLAGVPIETIATLMRQESINTAFRSYIGITQDEQTEAMERLALRRMGQ
jgi:site-specific recombinase XerD